MESFEPIELITSGLKEVIGLEELTKLVSERVPKVYFGTAPTGRIHIGYLIPLLKVADLLKAGCEVTILFADLHAVLDNMKSTPDVIELRVIYYERMIRAILKNINTPVDKLVFVKGSDFQLTPAYTKDMYKLSALVSTHEAKKAGAMVVKQTANPKMSGLLYPILQALDEEYLGVDVQLGGIDQRKILTFASYALPLIGYKKRIHLMTPMLTAINAMPMNESTSGEISENNETKMSSSDTASKIDLLDGKGAIKKKINRAYCLEGDTSFNPVLELTRLIVFPLLANQGLTEFVINRSAKYGGKIVYKTYAKLVEDFTNKKLHPQDLKLGISDLLNHFMEPIRNEFADKDTQQLLRKAYS